MKKRWLFFLKTMKHGKFGLIVTMFFCQHIFSQSESLNNIQESFINYQHKYLQEKIFVHTDKSFYVAGEIIWFKIYNVDAGFNNLIDVSKVAYIEIIDKDHKPVLQAKIALKHGLGSGSFFLPFSTRSGNYILRSYTSWMKNFSPEIYFERKITIINTFKKLDLKPDQDSLQYSISFFPEGGNLVYGMQAKLAFKAEDKFGNGIDFDGAVINSKNDTIVHFHPLKFGIGNFVFTPLTGEQYKAVIRTMDGRLTYSKLTEIYDKGYVMMLKDTLNNRICINVKASADFVNFPCFLFVHDGKHVKYAQMQYLSDGQAIFIIAKEDLDEGVSYFTLFNKDKHPVCERLYFKRPSVELILDAKPDNDKYGIRKKVAIDLSIKDMAGNPGEANMSMSVYKLDSTPTVDENSIVNYLSLTSCLKGNVQSPEYYMQSNDSDVALATDNLMLTHGWRRFKWENILQDKTTTMFEFAPENEGHIIIGRVINKSSGLPAAGISTYLSVPAKRFILEGAVSNQDGIVHYDLKDFFGADEVVVQTANSDDSNYRIDIASPFSEKFSSLNLPKFKPAKSLDHLLTAQSISIQVQNVYESQQLQKFYTHKMTDSTVFYGKPDQKYFLDDYTRFTTMEEVMREYITNITVRKHEGHFRFRVLNYPYKLFFEIDPMVLIDGVPVSNIDKVMAFDPLKIKKIELMNRRYFLGPLVMDGIISYTTYNGDLAGFQFDPNVFILKYQGLQLQREFYSPVYDTKEKEESRLPDFRNVLFWSPDVNIDKNGKAQVSFYSSDEKGKYIGIIQGISDDGKAVYKNFYFDVK
ncbi:MAG TPA: hypothetical protein VMT76_04555 [Puia sp.]|nr:hypothetical protein [Puia sp.]